MGDMNYTEEDILNIIDGIPRPRTRESFVFKPVSEKQRNTLLALNDCLKARGTKANRRHSLIRYMRHFITMSFENKEYDEIESQDLQQYFNTLVSDEKSENSIKAYRINIRQFFTWYYDIYDEDETGRKLKRLLAWMPKGNRANMDTVPRNFCH